MSALEAVFSCVSEVVFRNRVLHCPFSASAGPCSVHGILGFVASVVLDTLNVLS